MEKAYLWWHGLTVLARSGSGGIPMAHKWRSQSGAWCEHQWRAWRRTHAWRSVNGAVRRWSCVTRSANGTEAEYARRSVKDVVEKCKRCRGELVKEKCERRGGGVTHREVRTT
ncbi:hypothetical protein VNO80_25415 [Phaseolus coccineus]|uniref:Uncharacterized protein n=1 Tax=Phaseolus coccineus TaxID=3886 RepID=A0AAN9LV94_PHACN